MNIFLPVSTSLSDAKPLPVELVAGSLQAAGHKLFLCSEAYPPYLDQEVKDRFEIGVAEGGICQRTGLPVGVDYWINASIFDSRTRRYILQSQEFAIVVNVNREQRGEVSSSQSIVDVIVVICPTTQCEGVELLTEGGVICPLVVPSDQTPPSAIEDGPQLIRFQHLFDDFIYKELGPGSYLKDFVWNEGIRLRAEAFGGILFIPSTSKLIELDRQTMSSLGHVLQDGQPVDLLTHPVSELSTCIGSLHRMAAIKRPKVSLL